MPYIKFGRAKLDYRSNVNGRCIHFGKVRCLHPAFVKKQKSLDKQERCKGRNTDCKKFIGENPFIPKYDKNYLLPAKESEILAFALSTGDNTLLTGVPGVGKTSLVKMLAAITNWGLLQFSCSEETSSAKLLGEWVVTGKEMRWSDGIITTAMKNGYILLEDEADFMRPELRGELHSIMEEGGSVTLSALHPKTKEPFKEVVTKHKDFRWVSTANTIGLGDDFFQYHGTQMFNSAARDRYSIIIRFEHKAPEQETYILCQKTGIYEPTAEAMIKIANACRNEENKEIMFQFTFRRLIAWATYWQSMDKDIASELSVLNFCNETDKYFIKSLMRSHLDISIK